MSTRTYDFILTVDKPEAVLPGDTILGNTTGSSAYVIDVDTGTSNVKVKVSNVNHEFVVSENARAITNIVTTDGFSVSYNNTSPVTVNGNSFQIDGSTNTFSLPAAALSLANVTADSFSVFVQGRRLDKSMLTFPSSTLGNTGFDIKPIPEIITSENNLNLTKTGLRRFFRNTDSFFLKIFGVIVINQAPESTDTFNYSVDFDNWITDKVDTIDVRVDTGNTESIPFTVPSFSEQIDGTTFQITSITNSNFIREKNSFVQSPLVRLYTIYYPGEWYPDNDAGNPTNAGEGRAWPDGFPFRFAEVRGDINTDVTYNVSYQGQSFTPLPINSGGISTDSTGTINDVTVSISNFDNLITQLCEDPDLLGNNTANAVYATVNGEVVTGIDPRTVQTGADYVEQEHRDVLSRARSNGLNFDQTVVDSYGRVNASFTITTTEEVNGTWKREKADSRDLLGGVVEIKSTFANFLDFWPEYAKVVTSQNNVIEVSTATPYRVGDNVRTFDNAFLATIEAISEERFITTNAALDVVSGTALIIDNPDADEEAHILDTFKIDALEGLNEQIATFSLTSWLQYFKLTVPKRKFYKNTCQWQYKGAECQYPGPGGLSIPGTQNTSNTNPIAANNQIAGSADGDECGKSFESCQIRNNTIHFGAFPGTGRTLPR